MKQQIALGGTLLLMIGSAVAGTFIYGHDFIQPEVRESSDALATQVVAEPNLNPESIEAWKAHASASSFIPPKAPI